MAFLSDFLTRIEARKVAPGTVETPERAESLRNKGVEHVPEKREPLREMCVCRWTGPRARLLLSRHPSPERGGG